MQKNSHFIVVHCFCSTRKHQEYSTSIRFQAQEAGLDKWESFGRTLSSSTTTLVSRWVRRSTIWLKKCTIDPLHKNQKVKTICRWNVDFTLRNPWGRGYGTGGLTLEFAGFVLELFLWTLETFHFCIWMFSFKGLFLYQ